MNLLSFRCSAFVLFLSIFVSSSLVAKEYEDTTDWVLKTSIPDDTDFVTAFSEDEFSQFLETNDESAIILDKAEIITATSEGVAQKIGEKETSLVGKNDLDRGYFSVKTSQVFGKRQFSMNPKPIGSGNLASVHKATDLMTGRPIAIKLPLPHLLGSKYGADLWEQILESNYRLFKICSKSTCRNANLFTRVAGKVTAVLANRQRLKGVMIEYVNKADIDWEPLGLLGLKQTKMLNFQLFREIQDKLDVLSIVFNELISGVNFFKSKRLTHNDIKPGNIISGGDHIKINDFDTVVFLDEEGTKPRYYALTMGYAAPEIIATNTPHLNSDLFSVGMAVLDMIFGESPS